ncbi:hypothetical protein RFI_05521 [Reticulomyxa filosa]|uniref:Uncharacterized protein n=1 Tax=Reticulomyxa filosa TaxID=46433 RepID=X6P0D1_RETFI|nr:hypothetical protein RFI_05521 [Reticulomyxa filosa]|eukprot:ETO31598.1 hypothetical protein RFI_05521 [Reticulomyxa filosa]
MRIGGLMNTLGSYCADIISCIKRKIQQHQQQEEEEEEEEEESRQPEQQVDQPHSEQVQEQQVQEQQSEQQQSEQQQSEQQQLEHEPTNEFQRCMSMRSTGKNYKTLEEIWREEELKEQKADERAEKILKSWTSDYCGKRCIFLNF